MHFFRSRRLSDLIIMLGLFPLILGCASSRNGVIRHKRKGCDCPKWSQTAPYHKPLGPQDLHAHSQSIGHVADH